MEGYEGPYSVIEDDNDITDEMIEAACVAGYGVGADKDSNLYKLMKRALKAAKVAAE